MKKELVLIRERLRNIADPVALLEGIVAYSPLAIHIFKSNGQSLLTNRACDVLFGAKPPPEYNIFKDEILLRSGMADSVHRAFAGENVTLSPIWYDPRELSHVHVETGNRILIEGIFFPLFDPDHAISNVASVYRDVTEEWNARADLTKANQELKRAVSVRDDFLSIASHELRTPLTSLHLQIQILDRLLREAGDDTRLEELQNRVEGAQKSLTRMNDLITNLLDTSRISSGGLQLTLGETNFSKVVQEAASRFQDQIDSAGCRLELNVAPGVIGQWDASRLDQVVTNLLSNALKYGRGKPIHITLDVEDGGQARLSVRDEGIGIDAGFQDKIFDRFERAVSERSYGGFGLGLWIVRQIVESHGGTVRVKSDLYQGSTFTVTLPLATTL